MQTELFSSRINDRNSTPLPQERAEYNTETATRIQQTSLRRNAWTLLPARAEFSSGHKNPEAGLAPTIIFMQGDRVQYLFMYSRATDATALILPGLLQFPGYPSPGPIVRVSQREGGASRISDHHAIAHFR